MSHPLTVALIGAAHGELRVHFLGEYDGGTVSPHLRAQLHAGLDKAIRAANAYAATPQPSRRRRDAVGR